LEFGARSRAAIVGVNAVETLFNQDRGGTLAIGVGALGTAAAKHCVENRGELGPAQWTAAHFNAAELIATGLEKKILVRGNPAMLSNGAIARAIAENQPYLERLTQGKRAALLCVERADAHALRLLDPLANALIELLPTGIVVLKAYDGAACPEESDELPPATFVAQLDSGMETVTRGISERKIRAIAAERLAAAAECFAGALDAAGGFDIPTGEFSAVFTEQDGADSALQAVDAVVRRGDVADEREAVALLVHTARELPLRTIQQMRQKLAAIRSEACAIVGAWDPGLGERSACVLLRSMPRERANIVSLAEAAKSGAGWR